MKNYAVCFFASVLMSCSNTKTETSVSNNDQDSKSDPVEQNFHVEEITSYNFCEIALREAMVRDSLWYVSPEAYFNRVNFDLQQEECKDNGFNPYLAFGRLEYEKILKDRERPAEVDCYYAKFNRHQKITGFHFIDYTAGEDCERSRYLAVFNEKLELIDQLSSFGGCWMGYEETEKKDTVGKYVYFQSSYNEEIEGNIDSIYIKESSFYTVKDTITNIFYDCKFETKNAYFIDSTGHFSVFYEDKDSFNVDTMLQRMTPHEDSAE